MWWYIFISKTLITTKFNFQYLFLCMNNSSWYFKFKFNSKRLFFFFSVAFNSLKNWSSVWAIFLSRKFQIVIDFDCLQIVNLGLFYSIILGRWTHNRLSIKFTVKFIIASNKLLNLKVYFVFCTIQWKWDYVDYRWGKSLRIYKVFNFWFVN